MKKKRHSEEQIIAIVRQCEAGRRLPELAREHGISEHTTYTWKARFACMDVADAKRLRALEGEGRRLKQTVAELCPDKEVLKTVITKNGWSLQAWDEIWRTRWRGIRSASVGPVIRRGSSG